MKTRSGDMQRWMGTRLFVGLALLAQPVFAISIRHDVPEADYFGLASQYPAVGRIDVQGEALCSGTLVAPDKVLTAAHCVDGVFGSINNTNDLPLNSTFFKLGDDVGSPIVTRGTSSIEVNTWNNQERFDMAVITLSSPINAVQPMAITDDNPAGRLSTMIGFGNNGNGLNFPRPFDNRKRAAQNILDQVGNTLETDFDHPNGSSSSFGSSQPVALEGTTAGGDSGGPLSVNFDGVDAIVGVLDGGFNPFGADSRYGDVSIWAPVNLARNRNFLIAQGLEVGIPNANASGDFDADGDYDCADIDALTSAVSGGSSNSDFDLNGDGSIDVADVASWRAEAGANNLGAGRSYLPGDADLDGSVDISDFNLWNSNKFGAGNWCNADFNVDGSVDISDFNIWNANKFSSADGAMMVSGPGSLAAFASHRPFAGSPSAVPEPTSGSLLLSTISVLLMWRRRC